MVVTSGPESLWTQPAERRRRLVNNDPPLSIHPSEDSATPLAIGASRESCFVQFRMKKQKRNSGQVHPTDLPDPRETLDDPWSSPIVPSLPFVTSRGDVRVLHGVVGKTSLQIYHSDSTLHRTCDFAVTGVPDVVSLRVRPTHLSWC